MIGWLGGPTVVTNVTFELRTAASKLRPIAVNGSLIGLVALPNAEHTFGRLFGMTDVTIDISNECESVISETSPTVPPATVNGKNPRFTTGRSSDPPRRSESTQPICYRTESHFTTFKIHTLESDRMGNNSKSERVISPVHLERATIRLLLGISVVSCVLITIVTFWGAPHPSNASHTPGGSKRSLLLRGDSSKLGALMNAEPSLCRRRRPRPQTKAEHVV